MLDSTMRNFYYNEKGFRECDSSLKAEWINIIAPDADDVRYLIKEEDVPAILLEYLEDMDERPRVERNGEWLMTIVRIPVQNNNGIMPYVTVPLGIMSKTSDKIITVCYHENDLTRIFAMHTCQKNVQIDNVSDFTLRLFYTTANRYLDFLKDMYNFVVGSEKSLSNSVANDNLKQLMNLQKSLVFFNTSLKGDVLVLERIQKIYEHEIDEDFAEDVDIEMRQADTTVGIYNDILKATMDSYASIISNNLNNVMKRMSGISIILIVPTFVASLYGMNVDILLTSRYSFWIVLGIAAVLTTIAFVCLRRLKWI